MAEAVASKLSADAHAATVYAAMSRTIPVEQQGTAPSLVSGPMVIRSAAMTVTSTPAGARVTVNGIGWGETPVTISHLPPGQKVVRVTKEGYESQQRIISIPDDRRSADIRVTLLAPVSAVDRRRLLAAGSAEAERDCTDDEGLVVVGVEQINGRVQIPVGETDEDASTISRSVW